jgi:hypothetical protein
MQENKDKTKADAIREYVSNHPRAKTGQIIEALVEQGIEVNARHVQRVKRGTKRGTKKKLHEPHTQAQLSTHKAAYPRHSLERALRIPQAILEQNAGRECTDKESASFLGVTRSGPYTVELTASSKSKDTIPLPTAVSHGG